MEDIMDELGAAVVYVLFAGGWISLVVWAIGQIA